MRPYLYKAAVFALFLWGCQGDVNTGELPVALEGMPQPTALAQPPLKRNGKVEGAQPLAHIYELSPIDSFPFPTITEPLAAALRQNLSLLNLAQGRRNYQIGQLITSHEDLEEAARILLSWENDKPAGLGHYLDAYQIWGADQKGAVRFTGYFTPIIPVSREQQGPFQYPIYTHPISWEGELPARANIERDSAFKGLGLELAYAKSKVDIYYMQLQGSGYVEYPDGTRELFAYNGSNRHPYRSIEKYLNSRHDLNPAKLSIAGIRSFLNGKPGLTDTVLFQNPSYTFFVRQSAVPAGAGNVPLTPQHSIAVDRRYIPLGSTLLAACPVFDNRTQRVTHYEYRLLTAQDVGGAIRGPGHVDYYQGVGPEAARTAGNMNAYGRLWLLLPKQSEPRFISN